MNYGCCNCNHFERCYHFKQFGCISVGRLSSELTLPIISIGLCAFWPVLIYKVPVIVFVKVILKLVDLESYAPLDLTTHRLSYKKMLFLGLSLSTIFQTGRGPVWCCISHCCWSHQDVKCGHCWWAVAGKTGIRVGGVLKAFYCRWERYLMLESQFLYYFALYLLTISSASSHGINIH